MSITPAQVRAMPFRHARELTDYWHAFPPAHELIAMLSRVFTTWRPAPLHPLTEQEAILEHRRSLEERWKSGAAMSPKQIVAAFGGARTVGMGHRMGPAGMGGIGPFPGAH